MRIITHVTQVKSRQGGSEYDSVQSFCTYGAIAGSRSSTIITTTGTTTITTNYQIIKEKKNTILYIYYTIFIIVPINNIIGVKRLHIDLGVR